METNTVPVRRTYNYKLYRNDKASKALRSMIKAAARIYNHVIAKKGGRPKFKKTRKYRSFTLKQTAGWKLIRYNENKIRDEAKQIHYRARGVLQIDKKNYKFIQHRPMAGDIKTVTIKRNPLGQLWVCFSVIETVAIPEVKASTLQHGGFEFGLKTFLMDHNGQTYLSPEWFRHSLSNIAALSRVHSRRQPGSKRRNRARRALARVHLRIADQRRDFHFKLAHAVCKQFDVLVFEDLNIDGMKRLWGRKVSDYGFSKFLSILEHIALLQGKLVVEIDRFTRTTSICSSCAHHQPMPLRERRFVCGACNMDMDRDHNAARNILTTYPANAAHLQRSLTAGSSAVLSRGISPAPVGISV